MLRVPVPHPHLWFFSSLLPHRKLSGADWGTSDQSSRAFSLSSSTSSVDLEGKAPRASAKNFKLVDPSGRTVLLLGRTADHTFVLDFEPPFSPLQAFAVALTSFSEARRRVHHALGGLATTPRSLGAERATSTSSAEEAVSKVKL